MSALKGYTTIVHVDHCILIIQVIKTFSIQEGWWYIGNKGDGGVKSKGTRLLIEKEK